MWLEQEGDSREGPFLSGGPRGKLTTSGIVAP